MKIFINLLPPHKKHDLQSGMIMAYAQTMVFILFLAAAIISGTLFGLKLVLANERDYLKGQAAAAVSAEATDIVANIRQVNSFLMSADALQKRFIPWGDVVKDVAALVPPETDLGRIRTDQANRIFIDGTAATRDEALAFIKALKEQPYIADVQSPLSNILQKTEVNFSLEMKYKDPNTEIAPGAKSKDAKAEATSGQKR